VLRGHSQAVWGVAVAPNGDIWSASADKTIKIWKGAHCVRTLSEGTDCMRGLHVVPDAGVLRFCRKKKKANQQKSMVVLKESKTQCEQ
jgi:WD40 repeat protein